MSDVLVNVLQRKAGNYGFQACWARIAFHCHKLLKTVLTVHVLAWHLLYFIICEKHGWEIAREKGWGVNWHGLFPRVVSRGLNPYT